MTGRIEKTVFISYRRTNFWTALAVFKELHSHGFDVFFDYKSIPSGDFEQVITENVKSRAHFIVILSPSALERCSEPSDWLRREIETGLDEKRNIVPLFLEGFDFGKPNHSQNLTGKIGLLKNYNGLNIPADYFEDALERLRNRYLNVSIETVLHPVASVVQRAVLDQQNAANLVENVQPPVDFKLAVLNHDLSYVFLYGRNGVWWNEIPENLKDKLKEGNDKNQEFKSVALGPNLSWSSSMTTIYIGGLESLIAWHKSCRKFFRGDMNSSQLPWVKRALSGFKSAYGNDSTEYQLAGGTRQRDLKRPRRKEASLVEQTR